MQGIWRTLDEAGADVVVSGHDHNYERFHPQDADGNPDPNAITEFVVGTGGIELRKYGGAAHKALEQRGFRQIHLRGLEIDPSPDEL